MITGSRHKFESRCRERGYTLDEVRACIVAEDGDTVTVDETHSSYPRHPKPGLGDMIERGLSSVGITKERVGAIARLAGVRDCGCRGRQTLANQIGHKYLGLPTGTRG